MYSFYFLKKAAEGNDPNLYYNTIHEMLLKGGDTDTNAAIVGGMIGALVGL